MYNFKSIQSKEITHMKLYNNKEGRDWKSQNEITYILIRGFLFYIFMEAIDGCLIGNTT